MELLGVSSAVACSWMARCTLVGEQQRVFGQVFMGDVVWQHLPAIVRYIPKI